MSNWNPLEDGINHVNIYSKSQTNLGKMLSNFARCPIETVDGHFESIEGYWGWLSVSEENPQREDFRKLYGYSAKKLKEDMHKAGDQGRFDENFVDKIKDAIHRKFQTPAMKNVLEKNVHLLGLPICHYYYFGKIDNPRVIDVTDKYPEVTEPIRNEIALFLQEYEEELDEER